MRRKSHVRFGGKGELQGSSLPLGLPKFDSSGIMQFVVLSVLDFDFSIAVRPLRGASNRNTSGSAGGYLLLWWQAVAGIIGVKSDNTLRRNARRTWRPREGSRHVHNTAIRRTLSPSHPCGSVTTGVHG